MPRPKKCRRVCHFPETLDFYPDMQDSERKESSIILTIDEYETIRLIDKEGLSQEQCSEFMSVARTTVQQIYGNARKKLAEMLVCGKPLRIEGGDYELCDGTTSCGHGTCYKKKHKQQYLSKEGDFIMRIAVTYENGQIFQHFGHTEQFKVYTIEDGKIVASEVVDTNGSGHGALAGVLSSLHADALICGGIGGGARMALDEAGIKLYGGVTGDADKAVEALIAGSLDFNPDVQCNHHGDHDHDHDCGSHGCGEHHCGH